jgi:YggT family protein
MLLQIFTLILQFAVGLVAGTCLLRAYLHWQRVPMSAHSGNPLAPFVFAVTNWIVLPVRRFVPAFGRLDTGSLLAAYAVLLAKYALLWLLAGATTPTWILLTQAGFELLNLVLSSLMWVVIIYAIMSWVKSGSDGVYFLALMVEPLLRPMRRVLPQMGGVDLSPIALLLLLQIIEIVLHHLQAQVLF